MRLPNEGLIRVIVLLGATGALGACSLLPAANGGLVGTGYPLTAAEAAGPQGDYPMVLGDPFTVDGREYVPVDSMNYDTVGYAVADPEGGQGITVAHKTLPLPSYVEVTELVTGRTILARVERRGPMSGSKLIALSPGAQALLGAADNAPVRVRRVNPAEFERAELRAGRMASDRMDTPASLLTVLQRKLGSGPVQVAASATPPPPQASDAQSGPVEAGNVEVAPQPGGGRRPNTLYPLGSGNAAAARSFASQETAPASRPAAAETAVVGQFVVQAAAFSSKANAERAANRLGGFVTQSGSLYRVRTGPYASRGQADAALAKVREAGYSDARVFTAG
ncbi:SPOR domain-containing protein [Altererythrobacter sp. H2]|uniref:SPOR domain-containing protein n=1 Tax=Altererythrobacter sp. H2 TaxID=3108391 RepID=UPI002B4BB6D4|nr:SPOR domain-containing protein [Altererythrobacter sp. H2]WRK94305.1 SPOR domain-containing protein [Altererythrobacter sp. H2]